LRSLLLRLLRLLRRLLLALLLLRTLLRLRAIVLALHGSSFHPGGHKKCPHRIDASIFRSCHKLSLFRQEWMTVSGQSVQLRLRSIGPYVRKSLPVLGVVHPLIRSCNHFP
jgi:hypothetical protein